MSYKLKQGTTIATLANLDYAPADGVIEGGQAYVIEESLIADSDEVLEDGPATMLYAGKSFEVVVTVMDYEDPDAEEAPVDEAAACEILIDYNGEGGLEWLAQELELI